MCLSSSVGRNGRNLPDDVRTVQLLLSASAGPKACTPDGLCGDETIAAILQFQQTHAGCTDPQGLVSAPATNAGSTLLALRSALGSGFTELSLRAVLIHASASDGARFFAPIRQAMSAAAVDTPLRQAHFLAQIGHESGELRYSEEVASGDAYEGRNDLGNTRPGDGPRFKGRGLLQITGRANYEAFGRYCGLDLCDGDGPQTVAAHPLLAAGAAAWFWTRHNLNALADRDDIAGITRRINGGLNGLADREAVLRRAKWFLLPGTTAPGSRLPGATGSPSPSDGFPQTASSTPSRSA